MSRSAKRPSCVLFSVLALLGASEGIAVAAGDDLAFFETKIRPVLVEKCHECHSSQAQSPRGALRSIAGRHCAGGTSGPAVVPGDLDASLLYQAISAADGVEPMPPKASFPASVVADFRQWIIIGAPDPREGTTEPSQRTPDRGRQEPRLVVAQAARATAVPHVDPATCRLGPRTRSTPSSSPSSKEKNLTARPRGRPPHLDPPALV